MSMALLSECGKHRWRLERDVGPTGPVYAFFGINPSTADATIDDATVRKWRGFVRAWGGSKFIVGNVFGYRATDVYELRTVPNLRHVENIQHVLDIAAEADILVPCWGSRDKLPKELHCHMGNMLEHLRRTGKPIKHLGLTASGDPKHPLMLGYSTPLIDWARP